jgi:hypothetical protein
MRSPLLLLSHVVLFAVLQASCGDGGGSADADATHGDAAGPPDPVVTATVDPFPFTSVLSAEAAELLSTVSDDEATIVFEGASAELDALAANRILVVPPTPAAPFGLLRRIDAAAHDGDTVTLSTSPTSVLVAFRKVDITIEAGGPADPASLGELVGALSVDSSGKYPFSHDIDWVVFDGDKDPLTTEDRVLVTGLLEAGLGYSFHLEFDWGALEDIIECIEDPGLDCIEALNPLEIAGGIGFKLTFLADLTAGADVKVSGAAAISFEREIPLGEPLYLGVIQAGPIVLTPRLAASAGVRGGASARVEIELEESGGVEFGIQASGTSVWPIGKGPYLDVPSGSATIQAAASAKAWVNPRVELLLYSVVGPTIGLSPYVRIDADTDAEPCWRLTGGLEATLGIHLGVGPVTLIDEQKEIPVYEKEFASGECELPDGPGGGSLDPLFAPWAKAVTGSLYSTGTIDDSTSLAPTQDGGFLFASSTSTGLLKLSAEGKPLWNVRYAHDGLTTLYPERAASLADASILVFSSRGTVLRTDPYGDLLSAHRLDFADDPSTQISAVARTEAGGVWLAGDTAQGGGDADGWFVRFGPDGALQDAFAIRGPYGEWPRAIVAMPDGGAVIVGNTFDAGATRSWALRVDEDGAKVWFVRLVDCAVEPGLGEDDITLRAAALTHDGNLALAGYSFYPDYRGLALKVWEEGTLAWHRTYAVADGLGLQLDAVSGLESGGFMLAGTHIAISDNDAVVLAETDSAGSTLWMYRYDGPGRDGLASLARTPADNGVWLAATSSGFVDLESSALVMKVPRKTGFLTLPPGSEMLTVAQVSPTEPAACIELQPYADATVEPLDAALNALPAVQGTAVPLSVLPIAP